MCDEQEEMTINARGLNVEIGLAMCNGKQDFYQRMLQLFVDSCRDFGSEFRTAFDNGDIETAERLAHSLKGMSASIGAINVQTRAESLELACMNKEEAGKINDCVSEVEIVIAPLIDDLVALNIVT